MATDPKSSDKSSLLAPSDTPSRAFAKYPLQLVGISVGDLVFPPHYRALTDHLRETLPEQIIEPDLLTRASAGTCTHHLGIVYNDSESCVTEPHRHNGVEYCRLGPILPSACLTVISHNARAVSTRSWFLPAAEADELVDWFVAAGEGFAIGIMLRKAVDVGLFSPTVGQLGDDRFGQGAQNVWALPDLPGYDDDDWREVAECVGLGSPQWFGRGCILFENFEIEKQARWNWLIPLSSLTAAVTDTFPAMAAARAYGDYLTETFHLSILLEAVATLRCADAASLPARIESPKLGPFGYRGTRDLVDALVAISECRSRVAQLRTLFPALRPAVSEAAMSRSSRTVALAPMHPLVTGDHSTGLLGLALAAARHKPRPDADDCLAQLLRNAADDAADASATLDLSAEGANALVNLTTSYSILRWTVVVGVVAIVGVVIAILGVLLKG